MSTTVTVACAHPQGLVCELGLVLDYAQAQFKRTPAYKRVVLKGSQRKMLVALPKNVLPVATRGLEPGITEVDESFITEWLRQHPKMAHLVWIVPKPADLKAQTGDRPESPFEPMDPAARFKFGLDAVTKANYDENA